MPHVLLHEFLGQPLADAFPRAMPALVSPAPDPQIRPLIPPAESALLARYPRATPHAAGCLKAALWLLADEMDIAHKLCQDVPTPLGSAWHAHLHRREPDFFNAMYWWRRVSGISWTLLDGASLAAAVRDRLAALTAPGPTFSRRRADWLDKLDRGYDPAELVAAVEEAAQGAPDAWLDALRDIQRLEWLALFAESTRAADR